MPRPSHKKLYRDIFYCIIHMRGEIIGRRSDDHEYRALPRTGVVAWAADTYV